MIHGGKQWAIHQKATCSQEDCADCKLANGLIADASAMENKVQKWIGEQKILDVKPETKLPTSAEKKGGRKRKDIADGDA
ncbi:hypothetical protein [Frateuria sp. Soil773]|uniref:hypothetical protein n=1 Tax=Frateuria sp. Soil773 TaxID=1736407 RepID=UPI0012F919B1|nr:hypothetical protein [Frateuria sp. Soil773]